MADNTSSIEKTVRLEKWIFGTLKEQCKNLDKSSSVLWINSLRVESTNFRNSYNVCHSFIGENAPHQNVAEAFDTIVMPGVPHCTSGLYLLRFFRRMNYALAPGGHLLFAEPEPIWDTLQIRSLLIKAGFSVVHTYDDEESECVCATCERRMHGPFFFENWKTFSSGLVPQRRIEYSLVTSGPIVGFLKFGPYYVYGHVPYADAKWAMSSFLQIEWSEYTMAYSGFRNSQDRFHGGSLIDEITAMLLVALGARIVSSYAVREWTDYNEHGTSLPLPSQYTTSNIYGNSDNRLVLPETSKQKNFADAKNPLTAFMVLSPEDANVFMKSVRLYQQALILAETDPNTAWLLLISSIELAAAHWSSSRIDPVCGMRKSAEFKDLYKQTLKLNSQLASEWAKKLGKLIGAKAKFRRFLSKWKPTEPNSRPEKWAQFEWAEFDKAVSKIYDHRSRATHGGIPFPPPMHEPVTPSGKPYPEKPTAIAYFLNGGSWPKSELPLNIRTWEYIVRGTLLKWLEARCAKEEDHTET